MRLIRIISSLILLSWGIGFFYFNHVIQNYVLDYKTTTEAILLFGANKQRLNIGANLIHHNYSHLLLITGEDYYFNYKNYLKEQGIEEYHFIFDERPRRIIKKSYILDVYYLLKRYKINSIRLVIAPESIPRAIYELNLCLPKTTHIVLEPVYLKIKNYKSIFIEYNKYLLIILSSIFGLQDELNLSYS
jgi:hypothetical protein